MDYKDRSEERLNNHVDKLWHMYCKKCGKFKRIKSS